MIKKKIKFDLKPLIIVCFFMIFMIIQRMDNVYALISYFIVGEIILFFYLIRKKVRINSIKIFLLLIFFWFQEFSSAQDNRLLSQFVYVLEILILANLMWYFVKHIKKANLQQIKITLLVLVALLFVNFCSTISIYKNPLIFLYSSYDSCKYFVLIFYALAIQLNKEDIKDLLHLLIGVVIMQTICAIFQFVGITVFFDIFRGRYKIVQRIGSFRAIGMFPYGIELGNYSCILFALYYNFSKTCAREEKKIYNLMTICIVLCIILSGTRTSMINVAIIFLLGNIKHIIGWFKTIVIILIVLLFGSNVIDISEIINRTKWDMSIELPRTYYMRKGIEIWKDNPLFGIGFNTYGSAKYRERTNDIIFNKYSVHKFDYANLATTDSFMVELIPEFGVMGMMIIILYAIYIFHHHKHKYKNSNFYSTFVYVIVSIMIMSVNTSTAFINSHIGSWFWISCGVLLCQDRTSELELENKSMLIK